MLSESGLCPAADKICAVQKAPVPTTVSELKSFLGLINYYSRFLSNLSTLLAPLYHLLQKNAKWSWGPEQQEDFEAAKNHLTSTQVLAHYQNDLPLSPTCVLHPLVLGPYLLMSWQMVLPSPLLTLHELYHPLRKVFSSGQRESGHNNSCAQVQTILTGPHIFYYY